MGSQGRCTETGFLEFHHVEPYAAGGVAVSQNIQLRCRAHNVYEAELFFRMGEPTVVRESRVAYVACPDAVQTELPTARLPLPAPNPPDMPLYCLHGFTACSRGGDSHDGAGGGSSRGTQPVGFRCPPYLPDVLYASRARVGHAARPLPPPIGADPAFAT